MLQKILYIILGISIAVLIMPRSAQDLRHESGLNVLGVKTTSSFASPEFVGNVNPPQLTARAGFAYDLASGTILFTRNLDEKLPVASLTKLVTALVVVKNLKLDDVAVIGRGSINLVGSSMGLVTGEKITVQNLLYGLLITSSNDAALALANHASTPQEFTAMMNKESQTLNLHSTSFSNPVGWDNADNYSTAHDLSVIINEFLKFPILSQIVSLKEAEVSSVDKRYTHKLTTTNKLLLENKSVTGIKTGFTSQAKGNLILRVENNDQTVITTILGSDDREGDSQKLLDWIDSVYRW